MSGISLDGLDLAYTSLNTFLISLLRQQLKAKATVVIPDKPLIAFKEAIIFGFLGVLRFRQEVNVLKSVTQASQDSSAGVLIGF